MLYVGVLTSEGEMFLVMIEDTDELSYTEEDIEATLAEYFGSINDLNWQVLVKQTDELLRLQVLRLTVPPSNGD